MRPGPFLFALLVAAAVLPVRAALKGHSKPVERLAEPKAVSAHQQLLREMRQRRIIDSDASSWSPDNMKLLLRIRWVEDAGGLYLIKRRFKRLKGLTVIHRPGGGEKPVTRITREGFDRYLVLKTQRALRYFEKRGVDAKWVFSLTDIKKRKLFDESGHLTEWGDVLYTRASLGKPVFWLTSWGEIGGNRPPREAPLPPEK